MASWSSLWSAKKKKCYAVRMQVWRSVQVKSAAANELGPASGKNAGERAKRMSVGGIRTVTWSD